MLLDISNRSREEVQAASASMQKATEGLNRINASISPPLPSSAASASA